jgi:leader peptidase (prepilin peptidase) / N-methyltransferase
MTTRRLTASAGGTATFALCGILLGQPPLALVRLVLLGAALGAVVETDLFERRIPNRIVAPVAAACAAAWATSGVTLFSLVEGLVLVGGLLALSLVRPEALGMGDVKLALLLVLGLDGRGAVALLLALALAAGFGLLLLLRLGRSAASRRLPLAPFFAAGALIALIP